MSARAAIACLVVLFASVRADADDKILVLRAEGRADKAFRMKVEAAVLKIARTSSTATTAGDVTYGDAAAMVGCKPDEDKCKDEIVGMLAVDEIVTITTTPKPGGVEISVRRINKSGATKTASTFVTVDKGDQLDAIAPLFGASAPAAPPPPVTTGAPATPPPATPPPAVVAPPVTVAEQPTTAPVGPVDQPEDTPPGGRRLATFGMVGGGVMVLVGLVFWASASNIEDEIADARKETRKDLERVQDLEAEGDAYAMTGNVLAIGGLVLGGISTYYFMKSGKRPSRSASVTPIFGNGSGIAITWGGSL